MTKLAKTPAVTAILVCKERLSQLQHTLPIVMAQPFAEVVVVDYDCPERAGDWVQAAYPAAKVVRMTDRPLFNASAARNIGALAATSPWLLFIDADVIVDPGFLEAAAGRLEPGVFLIAEPRLPELYGTLFVGRGDFQAVGGFDDVFQGWGSEDVEFIDRLQRAGLKQGAYDGYLARPILHSDEMRTRHHATRDRFLNAAINEFYRDIKGDLALHGRVLDTAGRADLYARVRAAFTAEAPPKVFELVYKQRNAYGLQWTTTLKYDLELIDDPFLASAWRRPRTSEGA